MHAESLAHDRQITALRSQIPDDEWAVLVAAYSERLKAAQAEAQAATTGSVLDADAEAVETRLLETLQREADGLDHPRSLGAVPTASGLQRISLPESDPRLLPALTPSRDGPSARGRTTARTPAQWIVGGGVALFGLWCLGSLLGIAGVTTTAQPSSPPALTTMPGSATPTPLVQASAGEEVHVFYPVSLDIQQPDSSALVYRVLAGAGELGGVWTPTLTEGMAIWLNGTYINPILCLPPSAAAWIGQLGRGAALRLRPASGAVRTYTVARTRSIGRQEVDVFDQRRAGLTLVVCGVDGNLRTVVEAVYRPEAVPGTSAGISTTVQLADVARLQVRRIIPLTPTADLPPEMQDVAIEVQVENLLTTPLSATELLDELSLPEVLAETRPSDRQALPAHGRGIWAYSYRVPRTGGAATWSVLAPTGERIRLAVTLPGQPTEPAITVQLDGPGTTLTATENGWQVVIPATFTVTAATPLPPTFITATSGDRPLAVQSIPALPTQFTPGTFATQLHLRVPAVGTFNLVIGQQHFTVTLP